MSRHRPIPTHEFLHSCSPLPCLLSFFVSLAQVAAAQGGRVEGTVRDSATGFLLPGANVVIVGTSLGSATDREGRYTIRNVPPGLYDLRASYIGYDPAERAIEIREGSEIVEDFHLQPVALEGEEVVVSAQARGQHTAINQQLSAEAIVNVVSSARIQELPDANAAESIGRLPGVSVLRVGGEGTHVVIRGLEPKYNAITINGVRMSSSNPNDRSTDLSMISPYMVESIEVSKAATPDQDANVLGGTVNFRLREAGSGKEGPAAGMLAQVGHTGLSNAPNKLNNYKFVLSGEGRFFDNVFGLFAQAHIERRNLTSNELGADYLHLGNSLEEYETIALNLHHVPRDRRRANGVVVMDYRLPAGKITLANFASSGKTDTEDRWESFNIPNDIRYYRLVHSASELSMVTNTLGVEHPVLVFQAEANVAHSYSETKRPDDWTVSFQLTPAGLGSFRTVPNLDPKGIVNAASSNPSSTFLGGLVTSNSFSRERSITVSLDLKAAFSVGEFATGMFKFGGKHRRQTRSHEHEQSGGQGLGLQSARLVDSLIATHFASTAQYANTTQIPISPFSDPSYSYGTFLEGNYALDVPLNFAMVAEMVRFVKSKADFLAQRGDVAYFFDRFASTTNDYSGLEHQNALYVMATINVGPDLTLIPGVRFQSLQTEYTAARGIQSTSSALGGPYNHYDTTTTVRTSYWLPALFVRYRPLPWFDIRLSHTNTLAYPDYISIIPRIDVAIGGAIAWNDFHLKPSRSRNYDAYFSFYENSIGLFTAGVFLKEIENLIYPWTFYVSGASALQYYPPSLVGSAPPPTGTYSVTTFVNNPYQIRNWGMELDWQTHFWYLPRPLDGLVLSVNYTHIFSRAEYAYTYTGRVGRQLVYVDTSYIDRLLTQPNNIVNVSLGYDLGGFSARVSMIHQSDIFTGTDFWPQTRSSTVAYTRWDISVKQQLPWYGLEVYGDLSNLNSVSDISVIHAPTGVPRSMQSYGTMGNLGVRWRF